MSDVEIIMNKYNVDKRDAFIILNAAMETGEPVSKVMTYYNSIKHKLLEPKQPEKGQGAGRLRNDNEKLYMLVGTIRGSKMGQNFASKHLKSTRDRQDTQYLPVRNSEIPLDNRGKRIGNITHTVPVHRMDTVEIDGERVKEEYREIGRDIAPRYYYLSVNFSPSDKELTDPDYRKCGHTKLTYFNARGFESPPSHDMQFGGYHTNIPYIKVTVDRLVYGSNMPKPIFNESGEIISYKKVMGSKTLLLTSYFRDTPIDTERIPFDYVQNAESNMTASLNVIAPEICKRLMKLFMGKIPNTDKIYQYIKDKRLGVTKKEIEGFESHKKFIDFYGPDYNEIEKEREIREKVERGELRRKKSLKTKPKRNIILKKKVTTKPKCTCSPSQKRKMIVVKKKLTTRRKKR